MRRVAIVLALVAGCLIAGATAAFACDPGETEVTTSEGYTICLVASDPGGGGEDGGGSGDSGGSTGVVDMRCGYILVDPQPGDNNVIWEGKSPKDGAIYWKVCPGYIGSYPMLFLPTGDYDPPDPAILAQRALDQLQLTLPAIGLAPSPPAKTYVGLETWLWIPSAQWSVLTKSVTAGQTTVTVTATPQSMSWRLGGGSVTCGGPGRAWVTGQMPSGATTDCEFVFDQVSSGEPGGKFAVAASITFRADWTCTGSCGSGEGTLGDVDGPTAQTAIGVSERQSVNVSPEGS